MSQRNKNNSLIFITTLSVYLGLVLVGAPASSQVLAQAVLTSRFEVENKLVEKDDLDNQPDEKVLTSYVSTLEELLVLANDFLAKNQQQLKGKYEFDCFVNVGINSDRSGQTVKCGGSGNSGLFWSGFIPPIVKLNETFSHTNAKDKDQVKVNLILSKDEFLLKTLLNQDLVEQAEQVCISYQANLSRIKLQQFDYLKINLYENTKVTSENNQVLIVTRLPRGSLDALLKQSAKAEK